MAMQMKDMVVNKTHMVGKGGGGGEWQRSGPVPVTFRSIADPLEAEPYVLMATDSHSLLCADVGGLYSEPPLETHVPATD